MREVETQITKNKQEVPSTTATNANGNNYATNDTWRFEHGKDS